jgi:hypothetical protein
MQITSQYSEVDKSTYVNKENIAGKYPVNILQTVI